MVSCRSRCQREERGYLGPEVGGGPHVLVLGFGRPPGVGQLEALVAVAGPAVHAALGGLVGRRLTRTTHDGHGRAGRLTVALHDTLQREVPEEHADPALPEVDVMLTPGTRERGDAGSDRGAPPTGRRDGA